MGSDGGLQGILTGAALGAAAGLMGGTLKIDSLVSSWNVFGNSQVGKVANEVFQKALVGGFTGGAKAGMNGQNILEGMEQGAKNGALNSLVNQSAVLIAEVFEGGLPISIHMDENGNIVLEPLENAALETGGMITGETGANASGTGSTETLNDLLYGNSTQGQNTQLNLNNPQQTILGPAYIPSNFSLQDVFSNSTFSS